MTGFEKTYDISETKDGKSINYYFVSGGKTDIIKAIEYRYAQDLQNAPVYNLGFGDYDIEQDKVDDQSNTNNGDHYLVFHTVLHTVPRFFEFNPGAIMMVQGSDHNPVLFHKCKETCRKKCIEACKNINRRIKTYRYFVEKNYEKLTEEYSFFGGTRTTEGIKIHTNYEKGQEYDVVFCKKKDIFAI